MGVLDVNMDRNIVLGIFALAVIFTMIAMCVPMLTVLRIYYSSATHIYDIFRPYVLVV